VEIKFKTTSEVTKAEWESYVDSFNEIFDKDFTLHHFEQKYKKTIESESYHVFLMHQSKIVGACTNIPFEYLYQNDPIKTGLMVDVFILQEFRDDPYHLYRMYKLLKEKLLKNNVALVIAVPNDNSYSYWKNIVKWKDIGLLQYYVLPVKADKIVPYLGNLLNYFLKSVAWLMIKISHLFNSKEKLLSIRINKDKNLLEDHRYFDFHQTGKSDGSFFSYNVVSEDSIKTCYLIDFYNTITNRKDISSLRSAITKILKDEVIDLIVFVGKLNFVQNILFRVPRKLEPKKLYLTCDLLQPEKIDEQLVSNIDNWDFGLFNYDVR